MQFIATRDPPNSRRIALGLLGDDAHSFAGGDRE
jgi:hypothetical protein